jgi:glycosyltransferase involved in cell wall biosynthesis
MGAGMTGMNTAIVSNFGAGGSLLYLQQFAGALRRKNYPVVYYLPENARLDIKDNVLCRFVLRDPSTCPPFWKARAIRYPYHLFKYFVNAMTLRPERHLKVIHILFPFYLTDWITVDRLKRRGLKVILTVHEVFPHKVFLGGKIDRRLLEKLYGNADLLFVHADSLRDELIDLYPIDGRRIRVVPHGSFDMPESSANMATLKKRYRVPVDRKVLLFFGTVRENKGLDILLSALPELKDEFFLLITGDISEAAESSIKHYERIIESEGLTESVNWIRRFVSDEEVSEVFRMADAVALPYKKSFHAQSGVLHLSINYEKPCIVSDVGAIGGTVRDYDLGLVVRPEDPAAFRCGIKALFKKLDRKYFFNFRKCKEENNWDEIVNKAISAYNELSLKK